ncbi:MAG TPA: bifunctional phosphoribosylaminoimidazolecarboxamide formyltransferase/IMP cyclohydrolase [Geminicoccaceae bacterium]
MSTPVIRRALISVHDKSGLDRLAEGLKRRGIEIVSTGGTAKALRGHGVNVSEAGALTGAGEILDGRVKTLHPAIHAGILARRDDERHLETLKQAGIGLIDLVVVNLYPFEATLAAGAGFGETIEMIDVGGPAMVRGAAKNHEHVVVLVDPVDYDGLLAQMDQHAGGTDPEFRRRLAARAFARTAAYDAAIAGWLESESGVPLPEHLVLTARRQMITRYGENPHQRAAFYATGAAGGLAGAEQVQGKELSYNNLADADAALDLVLEFDRPAVVIVKHANPAGVAVADDLMAAHAKALAADPVSAFGGIVAVNRPLDRGAAEAISRIFTEVVIAPEADDEARAVFAAKRNLRLVVTGTPPRPGGLAVRSVAGGLLVQERDERGWPADEPRVVTARAPDAAERRDLRFAWIVAKHVKSNAIVFAREGATVGIGAGQMSRLDAVRIAVMKAAEADRAAGTSARLAGSVVASDAFFPFPDGLEEALAAGARAAIQPGGSVRDAEVVAAADRAGAAMLFTGERHFRH